ncbi:hypothetical protein [Methanolobus profundi]|uniref:Uncharacterized protein n=1 Tax=Methanolobus profundi TaxID=487685 RepID=A0A1I4TR76_9EURY|nr:hypothetical protein [Methanolobus profundi]SFM79199.1 hypothetical protein SAMN04488696_2409 [Methanolobus profundi]
MSAEEKGSSNKQLYAGLVIISILILSSVHYYAEYREINDPYDLAGRITHVSEDIGSYKFNISNEITILGETISPLNGSGYVGYADKEMDISFFSPEKSINMIVVDEKAYMREDNGTWESRKLDDDTWESNDQLSRNDFLIEDSTNLSMERTDRGIVLTAIPDKTALMQEADKVGLDLQGTEQLRDYYVRYLIDEDTYYIVSIETYIDIQMKVQGMNSPVIIHNTVNIYDYDQEIDVESPLQA